MAWYDRCDHVSAPCRTGTIAYSYTDADIGDDERTISCAVMEVLLGDHVFSILNVELGLWFGEYEEELVTPDVAGAVAAALDKAANEGRERTRLGLGLGDLYPESVRNELRELAEFVRRAPVDCEGVWFAF